MPAMTPALIIETVGLQLNREQLGPDWCRTTGIGPRRRKLGKAPLFFAPPKGDLDKYVEIARDGARVVLGEMCNICPHECSMKRW